jgi:hypothetical protein
MPPAARNPFEKGFLDLPKLLLHGACIVQRLHTIFPTYNAPLARRALAAGGINNRLIFSSFSDKISYDTEFGPKIFGLKSFHFYRF